MTPCGHTLCLECGLAYCRHRAVSSPGDRILCPVCRRGIRLPVGGLNALPNNLTMMKLIDAQDVMVRCDSEAQLQSALDMVDGLLACQMRLETCNNYNTRTYQTAIRHQSHIAKTFLYNYIYIVILLSKSLNFQSRII